MDSLKMLKGYGKIERDQQHGIEDQQRSPKSQISKPVITTTISVFAILSLTLILSFAIASIAHHQATESQQLSNSAESIRVVCNVTRFPAACLAAIPPSVNTTDPQTILLLSLRASLHALQSLASSLHATKGGALADCKDQFDDALSRLNDSLSAAAALTDKAVGDVHTWVSAAVTDQQTCLDGLEEAGDAAGLEKMKKMMKRSEEYTSNSLAIVANFRDLLRHFNMKLH
ncbi:pectinesterase 3-like [Vigna unguiculata]|uniref:pectinesterase n=1 Tax=Vigna unguiculata TaxID=3917 RepID=A0A4D6NJJ4_VIGUN|nr:pectinesterase 3-like [Vigna unguiculata]QCE13953.1 pectinesterase [Vigna unguiculata]